MDIQYMSLLNSQKICRIVSFSFLFKNGKVVHSYNSIISQTQVYVHGRMSCIFFIYGTRIKPNGMSLVLESHDRYQIRMLEIYINININILYIYIYNPRQILDKNARDIYKYIYIYIYIIQGNIYYTQCVLHSRFKYTKTVI